MKQRPATHVIIIGGGASGTLLACHLLKESADGIRVTLIERRARVGKGVAYDTCNAKHVVNVRASNMSAFQDDPGHFLRWLSSSGIAEQLPCPDQFCFVPRSVYGHYLENLIDPLQSDSNGHGPLRIIKGECVSIRRETRRVKAVLTDGSAHEGDVVVLATGNEFCASDVSNISTPSGRSLAQSADDVVLLIGTGLTMVDHVLTLVQQGHKGNIIAISRRGLLPQPHRPVHSMSINRSEIPFGEGVSSITHWLRTLVRRGHDWRAVVDALRPYMQEMWQGLSPLEKKRFLRHARPWWDVHRHRMAPEVEHQIKALVAEGRLTIIAGKIGGIEEADAFKKVRFRRRNQQRHETMRVHTIVECRGINNGLADTGNIVLRDLAREGMAISDEFEIGIQVTNDCALVGQSGVAFDDLFAIGPLTRGKFWEVVAVPDIRIQCERLAKHILERLDFTVHAQKDRVAAYR